MEVSPRVQISVIGAICVLVIVLYGYYRCTNGNYTDPLTKSWVSPPWDRFLDGWGASHFVFFFVLAYVYPSELVYIWLLGFAWELLEFWCKDHPFYLSDCELTTDSGGRWWYGRWEDIVMNTLGIGAAVLLRKYQSRRI